MKLLLLSLLLSTLINVSFSAGNKQNSPATENPLTAKASLIRYWNSQISNNLPKPSFLISKASPLNAVDSAFFTKLADQNNLATHLKSFCSLANLVCFSESYPSLAKHNEDVFPNDKRHYGNRHYGSNERYFPNGKRNYGNKHYGSKKRNFPNGKRNYGNKHYGSNENERYFVNAKIHYGNKHYGSNENERYFPNAKIHYGNKHYGSNTNVPVNSAKTNSVDGKTVNRWVEPGYFFRESMLKKGTVMLMPDITDKMPKMSFLPRSISSKLPFSSSKFSELSTIFHASENSNMVTIMRNTVDECEMAPNMGETKRCVGSVEDMVDFAVSVLGKNIVVKSTEGVKGSKEDVMIGQVKGINGGKVTKSVSCHQSLFPYMVYYCHYVPKVRVYEAEILDVKSKEKINKGLAICHVDTSTWSADHGAFVALGSEPGKIEVCHWINVNEMTWATAD